MQPMLSPLTRAIGQLGDRAFIGVLLRCLAWSLACFVGLHMLVLWLVRHLFHLHGLLGVVAGIAASFGATLLASWLFLPLAAVIGMMYIDRIAAAVEQRYYPQLPPAYGASFADQLRDALALGMRVLVLNILALLLALALPGIGLLLGWAIAGYAMGRGLFVTVAMRRMPRAPAYMLYRSARGIIWVYGGLMALAAYLPMLNLLLPIAGTAAMVHILDLALLQSPQPVLRYADHCG